MEVILKKAKPKNFDEISQIYTIEYSKPPFNEPWTLKKALAKIKLFSKYCDIWEIEIEKKLIGFIIINPNYWYPGNVVFGEEMAIRKQYQRKGIATEIFNKIFNIYRKKGFKIYIGVVNKKSKSLGLHEKIGAYQSKDNVIMEKKLK